MKNKILLLSAIIVSIFMNSCKKDTEKEPTSLPITTTYPNFSRLKVGNYWIYQQFDIDQNGNATPKNIFDSCYVEKDTLINGKTYMKFIKPSPFNHNENEVLFQRDSLHYIVYPNGKKIFSSQDFSSIFETKYITGSPSDTICKVITQMADKNMTISTPAGTFNSFNAKETYFMYPNHTFAGNVRCCNTRYSENIGIITQTLPFFQTNPSYVERRLIRYHLN